MAVGEVLRQKLPDRIGQMDSLAHNLWWSWHPRARDLFRALDYPLWKESGHNPVRQLREISADKLHAAANDPAFLTLFDSVMSAFEADLLAQDTWFSANHPGLLPGPIAYFCMEFAIHNSLPIYAGGLGVLAGDTCKEASDLGLPMVGVGFMYPQGYCHQRISADGRQEEYCKLLDFDETPVSPILSPDGSRVLTKVELADRAIAVAVWQVRVGRVDLYLLDTDVEENVARDRELSARLYAADREQRIEQDIVLGVGGVRVLRALGINPSVWHSNEGHASFMMMERVREEVQKGKTFDEAARMVRANTIFTTHTPVPAGHDIFPIELVRSQLGDYRQSLGIDDGTFLRLGQDHGTDGELFNMTVLGLKMADQRNAVSTLHGKVTRRMWRGLWPEVPEDEVPVSHVTNGIHAPTWIAPELGQLYGKYVAQDWVRRQDDAELWQRVLDIPDSELWDARQLLRRKLIHVIHERAQTRWTEGELTLEQVMAMGALLDHDVLTIGFVRRFTEYKRPALIFHDVERLKRIVKDQWHPVQIVFAGKSDPSDFPSKHLINKVYGLATNQELQGRIAFVEDYDMHMAHYLVQGVDVWLNNPRRLQEACGTSGMKAALNGVPHLSVRDGWWAEGYNGANGWVIGDDVAANPEEEDRADAEALYRLLEEEIAPLYYDRDRNGVPHGWIRVVKKTINSIIPYFSTRRMLKEYTERMYIPVAQSLAERVPRRHWLFNLPFLPWAKRN